MRIFDESALETSLKDRNVHRHSRTSRESIDTFRMDEFSFPDVAQQCSAPMTTTRAGTAEFLLRYASFATAGLPLCDVDRAIAILARQRSDVA